MAASGDTDRQLNESEPDAASNSLQLDSLEDLLESSKNSTSELIANDSFGSQFWSESTLTSEMNWIDNVFNTSMLAMPTGGINNNSSSGELNPSVECVGIDQGLCSFLWGPIKDFSSANNQFDGNLWNSLNYPFMDAAALTQIVADYFRDASDEVTILIQSTKITQKSYGSEKRFLCPPTQVTLIGSKWADESNGAESITLTSNASNTPTVSASAGAASVITPPSKAALPQQSRGEAAKHTVKASLDFMRVDLISKSTFLRDTVNLLSRVRVLHGVFKDVFVGDVDYKSMEMTINVERKDSGVVFLKGKDGGVKSASVRIVSKPTRKVTVAGVLEDLCLKNLPDDHVSQAEQVFSGSQIALFNRLKAQKISTKYLASDHYGSYLSVTYPTWQPWIIWSINDPCFNPAYVPGESPIAWAQQNKKNKANNCNPSGKNSSEHQMWHSSVSDPLVWVQGSSRINSESELFSKHSENPPDNLETTESSAFLTTRQNEKDEPSEEDSGKVLKFGDTIVLQNAVTGLVTRPLTLRNIDRLIGGNFSTTLYSMESPGSVCSLQESIAAFDEIHRGVAIGQLHRVCFSISDECKYLAFNGGEVNIWETQNLSINATLKSTTPLLSTLKLPPGGAASRKRVNTTVTSESAIWTIVGVNQIEYSFWKPPTHALQFISKVVSCHIVLPSVSRIQTISNGVLLISGTNFTQFLVCFLGEKSAFKTIFICAEVLEIHVEHPPTSDLFGFNFFSGSDGEESMKPVLLVNKQDGTVSRTGFYVSVFDS